MGHGVASAWGLHRQHVVAMPVSLSCGNGGGLNLRAVGGGNIHKLPCVLLSRRATLRTLVASRRTASIVASGTYPTCSGGHWWACFFFQGALW